MSAYRSRRIALLACLWTLGSAQGSAQDPDRLQTDRPGRELLDLPAEDEAFIFAVFGDRTGGPADGVKILAQAVADVNLVQPDLVMTVGDLINGYNTRPEWMAQMTEFTDIMDRLLCPWYPVAGNHDVYWRGAGRPEREHEGDYEAHFGPLWYALRHKDCWFLSLYTDEGNPKTGERNFSKAECQRMSPEQMAFLDQTLKRASDARHVFVFLHHPRWLGGNYGDDWEKVHQRLVAAGNVTAVFGGHIHRMVHSGVRDGIEYMTLATVGGGQSGISPEAGYLHHWNLVTVREGHIAISTFPVGAALDPRQITEEVSNQVRALSNGLQLKVISSPSMDAMGAVDGEIIVEVTNPQATPIEVQIGLESADSRWLFMRDHHHERLEEGQKTLFRALALHPRAGIDESLRFPVAQLQADYLGENVRISLPARSIEIALRLQATPEDLPPLPPGWDFSMDFNGTTDALVLASDNLKLPDGPFTLEAWLNAKSFGDRTGLICKTEGSEFGMFVNGGKPSFIVHLNGAYVSAVVDTSVLEVGRWHHLAGVFDGKEVRLYLDGQPVATAPGTGKRTRNALPLIIGADVDSKGNSTSPFHGSLDAVHLSSGARYARAFEPVARPDADDTSRLLLQFDGFVGPWSLDSSSQGSHPRIQGQPDLTRR
jgi:hypothetical protein